MKSKIRNWFENSGVYGVGLLIVSLCTVAFGGAYLGANMAIDNHQVTVDLVSDYSDEDEAE